MHKLLSTAAVLVALAGPALAASGDVVTHIRANGGQYPNSIQFITLSDGTFSASGVMGGVIHCFSSLDPGAAEVVAMLHRSRDLGVNPSTGLPVSPVFFTSTTPPAPVIGTLHPADCPAGYVFGFNQ